MAAKLKRLGTNFNKESAEQAVAEGIQPEAQASTMLDLFKPSEGEAIGPDIETLSRRNLPPMIKPDSVTMGLAIQGTIVKIVPSPSTEIKGRLLWLNYKGTDFMFPCTGAIRNALAPGLKDDDKKLDEMLEKEIGNYFYAKRLPNKPSKYGKSMFVFDVRTGKLPVKK